jgi:predicted ribosomally synthesized peptide with SipW-like signal peptide
MRRLTRSLLVLALMAGGIAYGTYAAFSSVTSNSEDSFAAGTVAIGDNDAGAAMVSLSNALPGDSTTGCIKVTYTGSLAATVRLYATVTGGLAPYLTLTVTRGTQTSPSFPSCTGFTADATNYIGAGAGVIYSGNLSAYPSTYATGVVDPTSGSPQTWVTNDAHAYKFDVTLQSNAAAQGQSSTANFIWEAQNQ